MASTSAFTSYAPFDSGAGANVQEATWREFARHWILDGVLRNELDELAPSADGTSMEVDIEDGAVFVQGFWGEHEDGHAMTISANGSGDGREDLIVARADLSADQVLLAVKTGTPNATPSLGRPTLTQAGTTWEIPIAYVEVGSGVATIAANKVHDLRRWAVPTHGAGGIIGRDTDSSDRVLASSAAVQDITGLSTIVNPQPNRRISIQVQALLSPVEGDDRWAGIIRESIDGAAFTTAGHWLETRDLGTTAAQEITGSGFAFITTGSNPGVYEFKAVAQRLTGSAGATVLGSTAFTSHIVVRDEGPT